MADAAALTSYVHFRAPVSADGPVRAEGRAERRAERRDERSDERGDPRPGGPRHCGVAQPGTQGRAGEA